MSIPWWHWLISAIGTFIGIGIWNGIKAYYKWRKENR